MIHPKLLVAPVSSVSHSTHIHRNFGQAYRNHTYAALGGNFLVLYPCFFFSKVQFNIMHVLSLFISTISLVFLLLMAF